MMFVDVNEPADSIARLTALGIEAMALPLNATGGADYAWYDIAGYTRQWERKQLSEALHDLNGLEEQLNRELASCTELVLSVEGVGLPTATGVQVYEYLTSRDIWVKGWHVPNPDARPQPGLYARWIGLKEQLYRAGVAVLEPVDRTDMLNRLVTAYRHSLSQAHTTLRRYVQPHIPPFKGDPCVEQLLRLKGAGVGPVNAEVLKSRFGTYYQVVTAPEVELVACLGRAKAKSLLQALQRRDSSLETQQTS